MGEDTIIRYGDQITISVEEYLKLHQDYKIMSILLIVFGCICLCALLYLFLQFLNKFF